MTNNEIISYLKENRIRHTVFTSMPEDVKEWCEVNVYEITIPFRKMTTDGWRGRDKHYCPKCVEMIKKGNKND